MWRSCCPIQPLPSPTPTHATPCSLVSCAPLSTSMLLMALATSSWQIPSSRCSLSQASLMQQILCCVISTWCLLQCEHCLFVGNSYHLVQLLLVSEISNIALKVWRAVCAGRQDKQVIRISSTSIYQTGDVVYGTTFSVADCVPACAAFALIACTPALVCVVNVCIVIGVHQVFAAGKLRLAWFPAAHSQPGRIMTWSGNR